MVNVYEQVKQALQDIVAPEIRALQVEIRRLDEKIDSKHSELLSEIRHLDEKIELGFEFRDRFTVLETKVNALASR